MRAKFIYEKFEADSDPIEDMGIGMKRKFEEFLKLHGIFHAHKPMESALGYAANQGEYEIVKFILNSGIHPDLNKGFAMKQAIEAGDLKMIELLCEYGADMKVYGHKFLEWTALRGNWSNDRDNYKIFKYFLEKGAIPSPTFFSSHTDTLHLIFYQLIKKYTKMNLLGESFKEQSDPIHDMGISLKAYFRKALNRLQLTEGVGVVSYRHHLGLHYLEIDYYGRPSAKIIDHIKKYIGEEYFSRIGVRVHALHTICTAIVKDEYVQIFEDVMNTNENVNEKFSDESDPVKDLGIGLDKILEPYKWLILSNYLNGMTIKDRALVRKGMGIKGEHTMYLGEQNSNANKSAFAKVYLKRLQRIIQNSSVTFQQTYTEWIPDERKDIVTQLSVYDTPIGKIGTFTYLSQYSDLVQFFGDPQAFLKLKPFDILGER